MVAGQGNCAAAEAAEKEPTLMQYTDQDVQQVMDSQKCNRIKAIHLIKRLGVEKAAAFVKEAAKPAVKKTAKSKVAAKRVDDGKVTKHKPTAKMQEQIDDLMRSEVRKRFGQVVPVCGLLGMRNSNSVKGGAPYQRYYLSNGHTVFVSNWHKGEPHVNVSEKPASKSSYTVAAFLARFKRKQARADAKAADMKRTAAVLVKAVKVA
jgi:hypothetical protein